MPVLAQTLSALLKLIPSTINENVDLKDRCNVTGMNDLSIKFENADYVLVWGVYDDSSSGTIAWAKPCAND